MFCLHCLNLSAAARTLALSPCLSCLATPIKAPGACTSDLRGSGTGVPCTICEQVSNLCSVSGHRTPEYAKKPVSQVFFILQFPRVHELLILQQYFTIPACFLPSTIISNAAIFNKACYGPWRQQPGSMLEHLFLGLSCPGGFM